MLNKTKFISLIKSAPLCAIDILIKSNNKYLLCLRDNKPAKNYYFVPGGRIFKNEKYKDAIKRILKNELNLNIKNLKFKIIGIYDHIYKDNFYNIKDLTTHYFVLALMINFNKEVEIKLDKQHLNFRFMTRSQILNNKKVHKYSKLYLKEIAS